MDVRRLGATISIIGSSLLFAISAQAQSVLYVDINATGPTHDGSSWCEAFTDLQDVLLYTATAGDEIRVADGTYTPDGGSGNRLATFQLEPFQLVFGFALRGGYAGCGADDPNERDIALHETVLSGDLWGNDGPDFENNVENSYHVVTATGTGMPMTIDGFTITAGNADSLWPHDSGAGMRNYGFTNPTVINCMFTGNSAGYGGGMYNSSDPTVINCMFNGNSAYRGGGMYNYSSDPTVINCMFNGNSAYRGGGMYNSNYSSPTMTNCVFSGNSAYYYGGGMYNSSSDSDPTVSNCVFWGNIDETGTGQSAQIYSYYYILFLEYCCVQGWTGSWGGIWNNGDDPLFINADGPDGIPGTEDDNLRLSAGSSCIDSGDNEAVPEYVLTDLDGNPRFVDDPDTVDAGNGTPPIVDRGAYEYHPADCNGNGVPDEEDIAEGTSEDCQPNGIPDECDVALSDCNSNGVPDDCDPDFDGDGTPDDCDPDIDGDGVPNESDACDDTPPGHQINPSGGPMGDWDDNCDVDLNDHSVFEICLGLSGPGGDPVFEDCTDVFDFDGDGDVDLWDFAAFQRAFTGVGP